MSVPPPQPTGQPDLEFVVDGHRADPIELSGERALVYCPVSLKPEQRVRVVLRTKGGVLRTQARVTFAKFEMPKEGARYRVELMFEGDSAAIGKLLTGQA